MHLRTSVCTRLPVSTCMIRPLRIENLSRFPIIRYPKIHVEIRHRGGIYYTTQRTADESIAQINVQNLVACYRLSVNCDGSSQVTLVKPISVPYASPYIDITSSAARVGGVEGASVGAFATGPVPPALVSPFPPA